MEHDQIPLVRRKSGGGTVYHVSKNIFYSLILKQIRFPEFPNKYNNGENRRRESCQSFMFQILFYKDLGNSNFTMIMPRSQFHRDTNAHLVTRSLHQLDIPAKVNQRHDIVIYEKKVSGSAYKIVRTSAYHHGTMLIDSDLKALGRYLSAPKVLITIIIPPLSFFILFLFFYVSPFEFVFHFIIKYLTLLIYIFSLLLSFNNIRSILCQKGSLVFLLQLQDCEIIH